MSQLVDTQRSLLFRRQRFVARHRKRPVWLRLWKPFAQALLVVGVPAALAYWVLTASQFTLRDVEASRAPHIDPAWTAERLAAWRGRPLVSMPMARVEESLASNPWVRSVRVHKQLPNRLWVEIEEKVPALVLRGPDGAEFIDRDGRVIARYSDDSPWRDLPVVEGSADPIVLANAATVLEGLTAERADWGESVVRIEALSDWDFAVETTALPFLLVVSAEEIGEQIAVASRHVQDVRHAYPQIERMDLRVAGSIVVKPVTREE